MLINNFFSCFWQIVCTWSTNNFVGINVTILKIIKENQYKASPHQNSTGPRTSREIDGQNQTFFVPLDDPFSTEKNLENGSQNIHLVTVENSSESVNISMVKDFISIDDYLVISLDASNDSTVDQDVLPTANVSQDSDVTQNRTFEKYQKESRGNP